MDFEHSAKVKAVQQRLHAFMQEHIYPNEQRYQDEVAAGDRWQPPVIIEELKRKARAAGLWNLFLPDSSRGAGLNNLEYAPLCEIMGRVHWSSEVFNCSAPDTGNMETLERYGTEAQKRQWLEPLLDGAIRSSFAMTEPGVASSDATNIQSRIERHRQQSMILVPRDAPGVTVRRWLPVFGFDHAPHGHGEVLFENVKVPVTNILLGEGRGFEIAQGRLGPGRVHHCMRAIGQAEVALEKTCRRLNTRVAFGKPLAEQSVMLERIAEARIEIDQTRLLVLKAADTMDKLGNKAALAEIAMIKVAAPNMLCRVLDHAIQAYGGAGVTEDFGLAAAYAAARVLRIVDGPDEVHRNQIAKLELRKHRTPLADRSVPRAHVNAA
jgi:acyl-CoA dehydrogenase